MMKWEDKCWGRTRLTDRLSNCTRHQLEVEAGGYCSFHYHMRRVNRFVLTSGKVKIVWAHGWSLKETVLFPRDELIMQSQVPHQFQVLESGEMIEEYWPDRSFDKVLIDDITRLTKGSKVDRVSLLMTKRPSVFLEDGSVWCGGVFNSPGN